MDVKDVVVFGDDFNDLVMFDKRWFSIAMGNASQVAKETAEYVTTHIHEDGVLNALKHYNLI